jgi:molybdate transport system regulatory protein
MARPKRRARLKLKAQILVGEDIALGPGKADLLEAIAKAGSISAAARAMGLSYRRAWLLVDMMNKSFRAPLVETGRGGAARGGAKVTELGRQMLTRYRALEAAIGTAAEEHAASLFAALSRRA